MSYPDSIYPTWDNADDYDGPDDYAAACRAAEEAYDAEPPVRIEHTAELEQIEQIALAALRAGADYGTRHVLETPRPLGSYNDPATFAALNDTALRLTDTATVEAANDSGDWTDAIPGMASDTPIETLTMAAFYAGWAAQHQSLDDSDHDRAVDQAIAAHEQQLDSEQQND